MIDLLRIDILAFYMTLGEITKSTDFFYLEFWVHASSKCLGVRQYARSFNRGWQGKRKYLKKLGRNKTFCTSIIIQICFCINKRKQQLVLHSLFAPPSQGAIILNPLCCMAREITRSFTYFPSAISHSCSDSNHKLRKTESSLLF